MFREENDNQQDWWHSMGSQWDTSDKIHNNGKNTFYSTFRQLGSQMDMYGYAKHTGMIEPEPKRGLVVGTLSAYESFI